MNILEILPKLPNHSDVYGSRSWISDPNHFPNYQKVFAELDPITMLEIGAFLGYSVCAALAGVSHDTFLVDFIDDESGLADSNRLATENIKATAEIVDKQVDIMSYREFVDIDLIERYDVIHIDGNHQYQYCKHDLGYAYSLKPEFIIGHDYYLPNSGVEKACKEFCGKQGLPLWATTELTNGLFLIPIANRDFVPKSLKFERII